MIYSGTTETKANQIIPLFKSGKPVHSKYNPAAEKISIAENFDGCIVIAGIGGGFHITNLLKSSQGRNITIIAVEADKESLDFCMEFDGTKEAATFSSVTFVEAAKLKDAILSNYLPALHGNFALHFHRAWENENSELAESIRKTAKEALDEISADYSVQAHFGRQWQRNILLNLKAMSESNRNGFQCNVDTSKIAAVIAAGSTLDRTAGKIIQNRDSYFVIATDTGFGTMTRYGIKCDAVVSVDAQFISREHFFCIEQSGDKNFPLFIFDIGSNPDAVRYVKEKGFPVAFTKSGHPLSEIASSYCNIPHLETGAGTVTIACCDWAKQRGFKKIQLFGADFAYSDSKPYAKGTYLERKFHYTNSRISTAEEQYASLMYRTELQKIDGSTFSDLTQNSYTSQILKSYEKTLLEWAKSSGFAIENKLLVKNSAKEKDNPTESLQTNSFDFEKFYSDWKAHLEAISLQISRNEKIEPNLYLYSILPFIAWLKKSDNGERSLLELFNQAIFAAQGYK